MIGNTAISGIGMALWDIWGKELDVPVWRLLGGKTRERIEVYTHLGFGDAMADTVGVGIAPHNPLGPLAGVAALHFDIATPNFVIQEEMSGVVPWYGEVVDGPIRMVDGHWQVPQRPGLGVDVNEAVAARHPFEQEVLHATHATLPDGTIVDW